MPRFPLLIVMLSLVAGLSKAQSAAAQAAQNQNRTAPIPELERPDPSEFRAKKVRYEFHESEVPDGVVFESLLNRIAARHGGSPARTIRKVRKYMNFQSDEAALAFIAVLDEQNKVLAIKELEARHSVICHSAPARTAQQMYRDVDTLSDISIASSNYVYDEFLESLDPAQSVAFSAWIELTKGGFQYYVFKAEESLRDKGQNPAAFYQDECSQIEQKLGAIQ